MKALELHVHRAAHIEPAKIHESRPVNSEAHQHATIKYKKYEKAIHSDERTPERYLIVYHSGGCGWDGRPAFAYD
jgi:hypothetical protein